jgi:tellurite resistance protein
MGPGTNRAAKAMDSRQNELRLMAQAIGVEAHDVLVELQLVGYKADTIVLLELAPAVDVAWADGTISAREREVIQQLGARGGVADGSPVYGHLNCWLDSPPSDHLFDASIRAIRAMLDALQPDVRNALRRKLVADYTAVAAASDSCVFGGTISNDERRSLDHIIAVLEHRGHSL